MHFKVTLILKLSLILCLLVSAGCNDSGRRQQVVKVEGKVLLDEEPLGFGEVIFQPVQGGQPATGSITKDGSFALGTYSKEDGAIVGRHKVRIVCYSSQDPNNTEEENSGDALGELLIPEQYASFATSGIEISVLEAGNAPFEIKLTGQESSEANNELGNDSEETTSEESDPETAQDTAPENSEQVSK